MLIPTKEIKIFEEDKENYLQYDDKLIFLGNKNLEKGSIPISSKSKDTINYIKKWIKELSHFNDSTIHQPDCSQDMFNSSLSYPEPIVSHQAARINALSAYQSIKNA